MARRQRAWPSLCRRVCPAWWVGALGKGWKGEGEGEDPKGEEYRGEEEDAVPLLFWSQAGRLAQEWSLLKQPQPWHVLTVRVASPPRWRMAAAVARSCRASLRPLREGPRRPSEQLLVLLLYQRALVFPLPPVSLRSEEAWLVLWLGEQKVGAVGCAPRPGALNQSETNGEDKTFSTNWQRAGHVKYKRQPRTGRRTVTET